MPRNIKIKTGTHTFLSWNEFETAQERRNARALKVSRLEGSTQKAALFLVDGSVRLWVPKSALLLTEDAHWIVCQEWFVNQNKHLNWEATEFEEDQ